MFAVECDRFGGSVAPRILLLNGRENVLRRSDAADNKLELPPGAVAPDDSDGAAVANELQRFGDICDL